MDNYGYTENIFSRLIEHVCISKTSVIFSFCNCYQMLHNSLTIRLRIKFWITPQKNEKD